MTDFKKVILNGKVICEIAGCEIKRQVMRLHGSLVNRGPFDYHYHVTLETDKEIYIEDLGAPITRIFAKQLAGPWNGNKYAGLMIAMPTEEFEKQYGIHPSKPETWGKLNNELVI